MEMEYITQSSKLITLEDHDVNTWREIDVYEWIKKIGMKNNRDGIADYCEKFLNHNINGKRLLLMSKADLRNIGIISEGHIIDLHVRFALKSNRYTFICFLKLSFSIFSIAWNRDSSVRKYSIVKLPALEGIVEKRLSFF